jgi:NADPH:quinone reductase
MKALVSRTISEPQVCRLSVEELPIPELPPNAVLVKVYASGVNPSDAANGLKNLFGVTKPNVPGRDFAGIIHASNSTSPSLAPGTAVYGSSGNTLSFSCQGTAAGFVVVPETAVVPKPEHLSFAQAAAIGVPYMTAFLAIEATSAGLRGPDRVLVLGATGAVGRAATRIARARGCTVVTASRRDKVTDINILTDPTFSTVKSHLDGKGPDVVIDTVGSPTMMAAVMEILAARGRYAVLAGFKGEPPEYKLNLANLYRNAHVISGVNSIAQSDSDVGAMIRNLSTLFDTKKLQPFAEEELVKVPMSGAAEAYEETMKFSGKKYVIILEDKNQVA